MGNWRKELRVDPIPSLISAKNRAIEYFARRDILHEKVEPIETLWELPEVKRILHRQQEDGSWKYPGGGKEHLRSQEDYNQIETYRNLGILIEKYGLENRHPAIERAAEFLFSKQTPKGEFRGIYGNQYSPNYSAAIMELLIKAGYDVDPRIEKGFQWLLSMRQNDGGWAIPLRTIGSKYANALKVETIEPDLAKPFSHLVTGVVLRAFAAHQKYRRSKEAIQAGELLASRFFQKDTYPDRQTPDFWARVRFPFWFTDIVSALDSLSLMGFTKENPNIYGALNWLKSRQEDDGLFDLKLQKGKDEDLKFWVCLAICRLFKRF
jgi:squalene cyclase